MKQAHLAIALGMIPVCAILNADNAKAILVYELIEQGSDVRVDQSGSLSGITSAADGIGDSLIGDSISPSSAVITFDGGNISGPAYLISGLAA